MRLESLGGARILIVDDNPANVGVLFDYLTRHACTLLIAQSGEDALELADENPPDLILLDILMPGIGGFETCRRFRDNPATRDIPVIFISSLADAAEKVRGFEMGGIDYITKPFHQEEVLARVAIHLGIRRLQRRLQRRNERLRVEIFARRRTEAALRRAKEAAEAASLAKGEFLANMSHEIRTPLNAIIGFAEILRERLADTENCRYLSTIVSSGRALLELINDILDLSRTEAGKLPLKVRRVSPRALIEEVARIFEGQVAEKGLCLTLSVAESMPPALMLDEARLRQVMINLVGNAVKFTETGHVRIRAEAVHGPGPAEDRFAGDKTAGDATAGDGTAADGITGDRSTGDRSTGDGIAGDGTAGDDAAGAGGANRVELVIAVADTGIGVPPEDRERIFGAFEQQGRLGAGRHGGAGLGLAISRRLVEMMSGRVLLTDDPSGGSVFTVRIPDVAVAGGAIPAIETIETVEPADAAGHQRDALLPSPEMAEAFAHRLVPHWREAREMMIMDEVGRFAAEVLGVGKAHSDAALIDYGRGLSDAVRGYDIDGVEKSLGAFEEMFLRICPGSSEMAASPETGAPRGNGNDGNGESGERPDAV